MSTQRSLKLWQKILLQAWLPVTGIAVWYVASNGSESVYWPSLSKILNSLVAAFAEGSMWLDVAFSMSNYFAGLLIGFLIAVTAGITIALVTPLRYALMPLINFAQATPMVSFVPVVIFALGIGAAPKIFLIAVVCTWPILLNTIDGVSQVPESVRDTAKGFRIPLPLRVFRVYIPSALPSIATGVRVAISVGVVMLIVSEIFGSQRGLGYFISKSGASFDMASTWAGTILIGVIGYLLSVAFAVLEARLLRWHHRVVPKNHLVGTKASSVVPVVPKVG